MEGYVIRPIRNEEDHTAALARVDALWGATPGSPAEDELEVLVTLIDAYEAQHHPVDPPDPVDAIRFRMDQEAMEPKDLAPYLGGANRVSEILNRRRNLSLAMIRKLHDGLGIPVEVLIRPSKVA